MSAVRGPAGVFVIGIVRGWNDFSFAGFGVKGGDLVAAFQAAGIGNFPVVAPVRTYIFTARDGDAYAL